MEAISWKKVSHVLIIGLSLGKQNEKEKGEEPLTEISNVGGRTNKRKNDTGPPPPKAVEKQLQRETSLS